MNQKKARRSTLTVFNCKSITAPHFRAKSTNMAEPEPRDAQAQAHVPDKQD